jgi:hypothetical protein
MHRVALTLWIANPTGSIISWFIVQLGSGKHLVRVIIGGVVPKKAEFVGTLISGFINQRGSGTFLCLLCRNSLLWSAACTPRVYRRVKSKGAFLQSMHPLVMWGVPFLHVSVLAFWLEAHCRVSCFAEREVTSWESPKRRSSCDWHGCRATSTRASPSALSLGFCSFLQACQAPQCTCASIHFTKFADIFRHTVERTHTHCGRASHAPLAAASQRVPQTPPDPTAAQGRHPILEEDVDTHKGRAPKMDLEGQLPSLTDCGLHAGCTA